MCEFLPSVFLTDLTSPFLTYLISYCECLGSVNCEWFQQFLSPFPRLISSLSPKYSLLSWIRCCLCVLSHSVMSLCDPVNCSLPGSSVYRILQVKIPEDHYLSAPLHLISFCAFSYPTFTPPTFYTPT